MNEIEPTPPTFLLRYGLLTVLFVAVLSVQVVHAKYALLTLSELHAYWLGRYGKFPFVVLPWSEQHFGGDALAMRVPLLVIFGVMLTVVLLILNRLIKTNRPVPLVGGVLLLLAVLAVQQYFSLRGLRRERRELKLLVDRVERAASPGEAVVVEWNLAMPLYAYGSDALRLQLRSSLHSFPDIPPVAFYHPGDPGEELIYVGSVNDPFAQRQFAAEGFQFHEDGTVPAEAASEVARYYRVTRAGIYFVSPPASVTSPAVSSKP